MSNEELEEMERQMRTQAADHLRRFGPRPGPDERAGRLLLDLITVCQPRCTEAGCQECGGTGSPIVHHKPDCPGLERIRNIQLTLNRYVGKVIP